MPQYPTPITKLSPGGRQSALNITVPTVIKAALGTVFRIAVNNAGSGGSLVVNDCATLGDASASNVILSGSNLAQGKVIDLLAPCLVGLVISEIPTGGVVAVTYN